MSDRRTYPDEPAGPFPSPPVEFQDREDRQIVIRSYRPDDFEDLVSMYVTFDPSDRAQGIPPATETEIERWLDRILGDGVDVIAAHDDRVVGHATLVPDGNGGAELAIFVHQDYQNAGIGTDLIRCLLGRGAEAGFDRIWLTVERWNHPAIRLYESVGFDSTNIESFELEMTIRLAEK